MVERWIRVRAIRPWFGFAGDAAMVVVCVAALVLTGAGPIDGPEATADDTVALVSQKCVLCGRAFADKMAQLCSRCDRGKCFKCGNTFPSVVARVCSSCDKGKCVDCGRAFPDKAARLCSRCAN